MDDRSYTWRCFVRWSRIALVLAGAAAPCACRRGPVPRITLQDVERCEHGVELAKVQPTLEEATSVFHRECSDVCAEPACRQAFLRASTVGPTVQAMTLIEGCSKTYCPLFSGRDLLACRPDFVMTPLTAAFAWPPLYDAILQRDASGFVPRLQRAFTFYGATLLRLTPKAPAPEVTE
jgi:hypothetical protein